MPTYRDEAIVLRTHNLGEADRIITFLTLGRGKVRAVAKGVRRTSSKFGGRLEPFSHVDLQFAEGRNLDIVTQAVSLHSYGPQLGLDYASYTCGEVMLEVADKLVWAERQSSAVQYRLLLGALRALTEGTSDGVRPASIILDSYLLRSLSLAGYAPALTHCARCGVEGDYAAFSPVAGGTVCRDCRPPGSAKITPTALELMKALLSGDWIATRGVEANTQRETSGLVMAFCNWQLEHQLRGASLIERDYAPVQQSEQIP